MREPAQAQLAAPAVSVRRVNPPPLKASPDCHVAPLCRPEWLNPDEFLERLNAVRTEINAQKKVARLRRSLGYQGSRSGRRIVEKYQGCREVYLRRTLHVIRGVRVRDG